MTNFEIIDAQVYDADWCGACRYLTRLGGCSDRGNDYGLGDWTYQFDVRVTNQEGETQLFTVAYQPEERMNGTRNYCGYEIVPAIYCGYDADQSIELLSFCDGSSVVLDALHDIAWDAAEAEYNRLIDLLDDTNRGLDVSGCYKALPVASAGGLDND